MVEVATLELVARTEGLVKAEAALDRLTGAANKTEVAAGRVAGGTARVDAAMARTAQSANSMKSGFQNLGFQVQDLAVQVGSGTSATQALGQQLPQLLSGFGLLGVAVGTAAAVLVPLAGYFLSAAAGSQEATAQAEALAVAYEDVAAASASLQSQLDKLRFGVDEQYQVDLLRQQLTLQTEYNAKVAELQQYQARNNDDLRTQKAITDDMIRGIQRVADEYNGITAALDNQSRLATQLAIAEGRKAQAASEVLSRQQQAAQVSAILDAAAQMTADTMRDIGGIDISAPFAAALSWAQGLVTATAAAANNMRALQAGAADDTELANTGQSSGPDAARTKVQFGGGAFAAPVMGAGLASPVSAGGGGGGGGGTDPFAAQLQRLSDDLRTEQQVVDEWYAESQTILADRRAEEILGYQAHKDALLALDVEYQDRLSQIEGQAHNQRLSDVASLFGGMASLAAAGGSKLAKAAQTFGAAEALVNSYVAFTAVLRDPSFIGRPLARIGAASAVLAQGLAAVSAINSGGGGSIGSASVGSEPVSATATPSRSVTVSVQGDGAWAEILRNQIGVIAEALGDEIGVGGFVVV